MSKEINGFYWIKTLSILLLFFVHSTLFFAQNPIMEYVNYFMLSNFFFISGFLSFVSQKRGLKRFWKNRLVRVYIPFLLFLTVYRFVDWFISNFTNEFSYMSVTQAIDYIYVAALLSTFKQNIFPINELSHLWFVPVLFAFMLLIMTMERATNRLSVQICVILSLIVLNGFLFRSNAPIALSERFMLFLINFAAGFWIAKTGKIDKIQNPWILPLGVILYLLLFLTPEWLGLELYWIRHSVLALLATITTISFFARIRSFSWVKLIASSALMVYLSEPLVRYGVGKIFGTNFYSTTLQVVALPMFLRIVISLFVGISVQFLFLTVTKKFSHYLNKANGIREKITL